jgi:methionyl-tRNA formyltransferase
VGTAASEQADPGRIVELKKNSGFVVACGKEYILIETVHPENKRPMPAWAFLQGGNLCAGDRLS